MFPRIVVRVVTILLLVVLLVGQPGAFVSAASTQPASPEAVPAHLAPVGVVPAALGAQPLALNPPLSYAVTMLAAGYNHTCALTTAGGVKCWGDNAYGQLGNNTTTDSLLPVDVQGLTSGVSVITAGNNHTCALTTEGGLKCWGNNTNGQLGDSSTNNRLVPVDVPGLTSGVSAVSGGDSHTCALTITGGVKCWGYNYYGQLGDNTTTRRTAPVDVAGLTSGARAVEAGSGHTCALTVEGGVKCWGNNQQGQLGNNSTTNSPVPVDVSSQGAAISAISAFGNFTCALTTAGGMKCWGHNWAGQLGINSTTNSPVPVDVTGLTSEVIAITTGNGSSCALTANGGVKCWGDNAYGQLGDNTTNRRQLPVDVTGLTSGASAVAAGYYHTCAITATGGVKCWGRNNNGQVGDNTATDRRTPVNVEGLGSGIRAIAAGSFHICALTAAGGVKCWGDNSAGQLGSNITGQQPVPADVVGLSERVQAITAGTFHTCALTTGGGVKCWGNNAYGQLGNNSYTSSRTPVDVVSLTSGVIAVASGDMHTCALTNTGGVKCWGDNDYGQLGDSTTAASPLPVDVVGLTGGVSVITAGQSHTCAVMTSGEIMCWGNNTFGQLGDDTVFDSPTPVTVQGITNAQAVAAGSAHTCALNTNGAVFCWGNNNFGQLGNNSITNSQVPVSVTELVSGVSMITGGGNHSCALTTTGGVKCWGFNAFGQLGSGSTTDSLIPVDTSGLTSGVSEISAHTDETCALTSGGGIKCWGENMFGQLGNGLVGGISNTPVQVSGLVSSVFPTLTLEVNPIVFGQFIQFTAKVAGPVGTPGGAVQFCVDGMILGDPVALVNGSAASIPITHLAGAHLVQAHYSGDSNYAAGATAGAVQAVMRAATTTTLTSSSNPSIVGQPVTFTATVRSASITPVGTVTFKDGGTVISDCSAVSVDAETATCTTSALTGGLHTITAEFSDSNFTPSSAELSPAQRVKSLPVITWANPANIKEGTALGIAQLNATANVTGDFAYTPAAGTVLAVGTHTLHVEFTPEDTTAYTTASKDVSITVDPKPALIDPVITWANPANINPGTPLSSAQLNATANVPGTFAYTPAAGAVLPPGTHTLRVVFTPDDTDTYNTKAKEVTITVNEKMKFFLPVIVR